MTLRQLRIGTLTVGAALVLGASSAGGPSVAQATAVAAVSSRTSGSAAVPAYRSVRTYPGVAVPVRLRIPALGVDSTLERLGLAGDGTITAPSRWQEAGWYEGGPRPGQQGPAVIVGHVDSTSGPAVFYRLAALRPGDVVDVDRADGSTAGFRVTGRQQVPKDRFPANLIYSPTLRASLILMTCGGAFDAASGHYEDNILVTALPS